ncbi:MAG: helix-turn-helix domain-containing protein, partial [Candidatus Acidiferrum sp.]
MSVLSTCIKGELARARAAELLCLSVRQVKRLKKRLREVGAAALAHANRGRPSHRRLPDKTRQAILRLARSKYLGFNDHHLAEKLAEVEGFPLSRETLRRLLRKEGLGSPRKRRPRVAREGELVQLDGSPHDWLAGRGPRQSTEFDRALANLGITFVAAQSPQAKGRVERLWGVLQDRLCSKLRLAQACDFASANAVLRKFITDYNRRFAHTPCESAKAWRPAPEGLQRICASRHERVVSNYNVVQWEGRHLQIPPQNRRFSFA